MDADRRIRGLCVFISLYDFADIYFVLRGLLLLLKDDLVVSPLEMSV
jgi:hypothetical protein